MNYSKSFICILLLIVFNVSFLQAQATNAATGGDAVGIGGSVSFTVGQISCSTFSGANGTVTQGVQQPYEISVVTAIKNAEEIILECTVYPNPTHGRVNLIIRTRDFNDFSFQLYDLKGVLIQNKKIGSEETEIFMDNLSSSTYFLKVLNSYREVKTFKIIKN